MLYYRHCNVLSIHKQKKKIAHQEDLVMAVTHIRMVWPTHTILTTQNFEINFDQLEIARTKKSWALMIK